MMIGEINQGNLYLLLPSKVSWLAGMIQKHKHLSLVDAIKEVYKSNLYKQMEQEDTKMWNLGPVDLYNELTDENTIGHYIPQHLFSISVKVDEKMVDKSYTSVSINIKNSPYAPQIIHTHCISICKPNHPCAIYQR